MFSKPYHSNLDHLVHLKWLDLSFNNIKAIAGLEKLTELMDLSLYNNQVKRQRASCARIRFRAQVVSLPSHPFRMCVLLVSLLIDRTPSQRSLPFYTRP